jgi:restriction system protein
MDTFAQNSVQQFCPSCGFQLDGQAAFCPSCGSAVKAQQAEQTTKFCQFCGQQIDAQAVVCLHCGRQVSDIQAPPPQYQQQYQQQPQIVINNTSNGYPVPMGRPKDKWVAFILAFFLGYWGIHRFYEGKIGTGILYIFTFGLFGIGCLVDWIIILTKPNPYYV